MKESNRFSIVVDEANGVCAVGERQGHQNRMEGKIPVISCEGACIRGESRVSTWIYRIATHAALDRLRGPYARQRQGKKASTPPIEEVGKEIWTDEEEAPAEQRVIRKEMNGCIREIVDTLPANYRSVIVLGEMEGLKDAEIAEVLGINLQTAKMRLHRGRAMLKRELSTACVFYRDERNELACDRKDVDALIRINKRGD